MTFIGYGAFHHLDAERPPIVFARFTNTAGRALDMPLTEEQLQVLLDHTQSSVPADVTSPESAVPEKSTTQAAMRLSQNNATIRIAEPDDDDGEGDL